MAGWNNDDYMWQQQQQQQFNGGPQYIDGPQYATPQYGAPARRTDPTFGLIMVGAILIVPFLLVGFKTGWTWQWPRERGDKKK